jgi:hypothetical protein
MGNCLERNLSDDDERPIGIEPNSSIDESNSELNQNYSYNNSNRGFNFESTIQVKFLNINFLIIRD